MWIDKMPKKIMIVDDEPDTADSVKMILEVKGYDVVSVQSGKECLDYIQKEKVDLILIDLMMPEMGGWELFDRLESDRNTRSIKKAILSVKSPNHQLEYQERKGRLDSYFMKPVDIQNFMRDIREVLGNKNA